MSFSAGILWGEAFPTDSHPATLDAARDLLHAVCPADASVTAGAKGVTAGCKACPAIVPGGNSLGSDGSGPAFSLDGVIYGSFTRTGAEEAVANFSGCEPHANNFGGSILLEKSPSGWKAKSYQAGFISDQCLKYRLRAGRDLMLCEGGYTGQGEIDSQLFIFDYALQGDHQTNTLLSTMDNVGACLPGDKIVGSIESVHLRDLNHDGMPDLVVTLKAGKVKPPAGHEQDCGDSPVLPAVKTQELDFLFDDGTFKVAPWSAKAKQAVDAVFAQ